MSTNFNEDSHSKGKQFEDFVENVLFPNTHYEILHRTNPFEQNSVRFVTSTLEPDFKIKSRVTGEEFYVEAKYRSKTFNDRYGILSDQQLASFPELAEDTPIYIAFGCGGEAEAPEFVSLIPYSKEIGQTMLPKDVLEYKIEKKAFQVSDLPKQIVMESKTDESPIEVSENLSSEEALLSKGISGNKKIVIGVVLLAVLLIAISSFFTGSTKDDFDYKGHLQDKVITYYKLANNYEFDSLMPFFDKRVNWYGAAQMKPKEIIASAKNSLKNKPFIQSIVDPDSFKIIKQNDGDYYVTYDIVYKSKRKQVLPYEVYNLKLITYWNSKFKLKSVSEVRK